MRALITGCAGFIGSHLSEALLADGHSVLGVDCFSDNYERSRKLANLERARQHDAFELAPVDLAAAPLDGLVADCDAVFHLAAEPGVRSSWEERFEVYLRRNVHATQRLLDAASASPEKPFVFASSSSIYGEAETLPTHEDVRPRPYSPYGATKLAAESLCRLYHDNHGVRATALRYFTVYGPRQRPDMAFHRFCRAALAGEPLTVYGDGSQTRDFTFVADVVEATRRAAEVPEAAGRAYNIGGGSRISLRRALELLGELAERPLEIDYTERQRGDVRHTGAATERARDELGFRPRTSFEHGLRAELEWLHRVQGTGARRRAGETTRGRGGSRQARRPARLAPAATNGRRERTPRFLFHSNEIVGLGHLRRALSICGRLGDLEGGAGSLILSGSPIAPFFALPAGVDTVKLPSRSRDANGVSRSASLAVEPADLNRLRSSIADAATESFDPDVIVVDKVPLGLDGELAPALHALARDSRRRLVLGLRDIDDSPERVRRKWSPTLRETIESHFDAVLVYGPESSPDALRCLGWDDLGVPVHRVGYLGQPMPTEGPDDLGDGYLLATAGGGSDGFELLSCFARALRERPLELPAVIVPGPLMGAREVAELRRLTEGTGAEVHGFRPDMDRVVAGARGVVSMAGYNSVAELMRAHKPALLVPRVSPSEEQLIRARALAEGGMARMLHPASMRPGTMRNAIDELLEARPPAPREPDYRGAERAARILADLAERPEAVAVQKPATTAAELAVARIAR